MSDETTEPSIRFTERITAADVYDHGPLPESVGLLVSGGHTHLLHVRSLGEPIEELGVLKSTTPVGNRVRSLS